MILLFDVGATKTRIAVSDGISLLQIQRYDTDSNKNGSAKLLQQLSSMAGSGTVEMVIGGVPGQLDRTSGRLLRAPNLPEWVGGDIVGMLRGGLDCPVDVRNDVELVALGEAHYGAGQGFGIVAYLTASTGVNGARIVDGRIDRSARGFELGAELIGGPDGRLHGLEELTGGAAMARRFGQAPREVRDPAVWHAETAALAQGVYDTMLYWSPDVVVLGGSMMRDIDLHELEAAIERLPDVYGAWPPLRRGELGDDGGLYGALVLAGQEAPDHGPDRGK